MRLNESNFTMRKHTYNREIIDEQLRTLLIENLSMEWWKQ